MPYDPSVVQVVHMYSLVLNNYGSYLYNIGYHTRGLNLIRQALDVDPSNYTAQNNLSTLGGYGW